MKPRCYLTITYERLLVRWLIKRPANDDRAGHPEGTRMMDVADRMMLASVQTALSVPFRDPVRVSGQLMPRSLARQIERQLLRLRILERRGSMPAVIASFHSSGVPHA